ncbi:MAG: sensor histidine kinase [Chloroflexota bacterium]|nr:sensor histidine kinase [Chloroflexota bacterium]
MDSGQAAVAISTRNRIAVLVSWLLCALSAMLVAGALVFAVLNDTGVGAMIFFVSVMACAVVGGLVVSRQPRHPVGWFFLASALSYAIVVLTSEYATYGLLTEPGSLPLARAMVWPQGWLWVPGAVLILVFLPLYFPDGRLVSPRWRPVAWFAVVFSVLGLGVSAFQPGEIPGSGFVNPLGIEALRPVSEAVDVTIMPLWLGLLVISAASLAVRFRRSIRAERQQIKWLAFAASVIPAWFAISPTVEAMAPTLFEIVDALVFVFVPVAAGIAILRYRLYDIDLIVNRTLVYGALTGCVVGIYVLVVGYLGQLLRADDSLAISLLATGVVAVLFVPLRDRLQRAVNRLMYGERDDPYGVLSRLGQRLKTTIAPEAILPTIVETVAGGLKLPYAAISLAQDDGFETAAEYGTPVGKPLILPLTYGTETIGRLILAPRALGESFNPADRRLLDGLARHAEVAIQAVRLTADLQRSRERLVNAREEERRRLRRDLHDGLGPQLATLTLKLDAARNQIPHQPAAAEALLVELKAQTQTAIADIRRLVYDLRPPALDDLGLVPALREQATGYSEKWLSVSVEAPEPLPPLPAAIEVAAYRIIQEALTNVVRHAGAHVCRVRLSVGNDLQLEITDDGVGLPENPRAGVGLHSMRERAAELSGTCAVEPLRTGGTRVLARLPLPAAGMRP